jgi:hypothetical protein
MNLTLRRTSFTSDGIFGTLFRDDSSILAYTLEHAYAADSCGSTSWMPKLAPGTYTCARGMHKLEHMTTSFETFQVTGVPDFQGLPVTGILIHVGNYNKDSIGCILIGTSIIGDTEGAMLAGSDIAFKKLLKEQYGIDSFQLTVKS